MVGALLRTAEEQEAKPGGHIDGLAEVEQRVADTAEAARTDAGDRPLVAIAVPTHEPPIANLERLVESIRAQDHGAWICIISDDCSPADRLAAIRSIVRGDGRFVLASSLARIGERANAERALRAIGGAADLIALGDPSDRWHPRRLSRLIEALGPDGLLAHSDVRLLGPDGHTLVERLRAPSALDAAASLFRRDLIEIALPFPDLEVEYGRWLALAAESLGGVRFEHDVLTEHCATDPIRARELLAGANGSHPRTARTLWRRGRVDTCAPEAEAVSILRERREAIQPRIDRRPTAPDGVPSSELAISVQGVTKTFAIPAAEPKTIVGRLTHPLRHLHGDRLTALSDISFEVARGEFFGIAGSNGSGKTTLLQILANIYKADRGTVWIAPRVAPIISLGIGFHQDLPALPNVLMTAELLGVPPAEVRRRFDEVMAFAGLEDFAHFKVRNYSSGMRVRLAFATVMLVDADVLLFDEVLAVGDAAFREKTREAFEALGKDKTVIFVTHHMSHLVNYCDRALLLNHGRVEMIGDPNEVARRYVELGLEAHGEPSDLPPRPAGTAARNPRTEIVDLWLADARGERTASASPGEDILLNAIVRADRPIREAGLRFEIRRKGAARLFASPTLPLGNSAKSVDAGERLQAEITIENKLAPGAYTAVCTVTARTKQGMEQSVSPARTIDFMVGTGETETVGVIDLAHSVRVRDAGDGLQRRRDPRHER